MPALSSGDLALLRSDRHRIKEYLAVMQPATVLACQLDGAPTGDPVTQINYDNVTEGSYADVVPGMTLWVGTSAGGRQKGTCRVRKAPTSSILYIAEDSKIDWEDDHHLTVVENYECWIKYPRVVVDGSIAFYKDWDVAYSDQHSKWRPVAILGPPDCQFIDPGTGLATCKFVGEQSYPVAPGASITGHSWTFPSGTPSSSSSPGTEASPIQVTWNTPGIYWISLTVTDSNGKTHTGWRPIFIFSKTGANAPYTKFKMTGRSGDLNSHGHTASFEIYGDADQAEFPDGAMVVYWTEDWYGATKKSIGGNFPYRSHIKFAGYIQRESTTKDPQTSVVTFEAATINSLMASREGFSCWIKTKGNAGNWCEATNLTADRAALSLCRYHSTILDICDVTISGNALKIKSQEFAAKTAFLQQLQTLYDDLFAHVACDKQGRVHFEIDPQMRPLAERSSIAIVADLEHGDWRERLDLPRPQEPKTSFINLAGVYYPGYPQDVVPILSKAPGDAPAYGGTTREISGLILAGQSDGNEKAGLALAYDNNEFPDVSLPMTGNWDVFDIVPQEYVRFSLAAEDTKRGIVWVNQKLLVRRMELALEETEAGRVPKVDIQIEKDSYGPAGVDGDYPNEVPEPDWNFNPYPSPPLPTPGGQEGDGHLLYFVSGPDGGASKGRVFRTRNARVSNPADVVYEDLGIVSSGGLYYITLDSWDPLNSAIVCGRGGAWKTTNLNDTIPTWTQVLSLPAGYYANMAASSICQKDLWMIIAWKNDPSQIHVFVSTDGFDTYVDRYVNSGWVANENAKCEWSAHDANKAWVTAARSDGKSYCIRTLNQWSNWTTYELSCLGHNGGLAMANSYHRYLNNSDDNYALYGQHEGGYGRAVTGWFTSDVSNCTPGYPGGEGVTSEHVIRLGGYTWGIDKYWCLNCDYEEGKWKFYISDDAINWTLQKTFPGGTRFISGWPYDGERFYAVQNGTVAPILISDDRGVTWQAQTGNWADLGYNGDFYCCVPVWIE